MEQNVTEMEIEIRKRIGQYRKMKWTGFALSVLGIVYLIIMFAADLEGVLYWAGGFAYFLVYVSIILTWLLLYGLGFSLMYFAGIKLTDILMTECNPFLYEACITRIKSPLYKDRMLCNVALAKYYEGEEEKALEILNNLNINKLKGVFLANYYILLSALYFKRGMGQQVSELERAYLGRRKNNKKERNYFSRMCADNNFVRAVANKDYDSAFRFLNERKELDGKTTSTLFRVIYAYREAQIYEGLEEKKSELYRLRYVSEYGGKLGIVQETRKKLDMQQ